jgi:DNA-binding response OmpR family regulator
MSARILIVEDEPVIALEMQGVLAEAGFAIAGVAGSIERALRMVDTCAFDCAVLDSNLRGEPIDPVATLIRARGTPIVFVSGYGRNSLPGQCSDAPLVPKPFNPPELIRVIRTILERAPIQPGAST